MEKLEILGKTVYVLGAGASAHTGAPLLNNFLARARDLPYITCELSCGEAHTRLFQWIEDLKRSSYNIDVNLDNLEHVFSLADLGRQLGLEDFDLHFSDLRVVLAEVFDHVPVRTEGPRLRYEPDKLYTTFVNRLNDLASKRRTGTSHGNKAFAADSVVTFNYDVFLDGAWEPPGGERKVDYCLDNTPVSGWEPSVLLKLHGSLNWKCCAECDGCEGDKRVHVKRPKDFGELVKGIHAFSGDKAVAPSSVKELRLGGWASEQRGCDACDKGTRHEPLIVPPTWSKKIEGTPLGPVWRRAVREIQGAAQIVIIGYSLPQTDTFLQYLFALAVQENTALRRVVVVNSDDSDAFRERYRRVFSRSLAERGGLVFIAAPFKEFCQGTMEFMNRDSQELRNRVGRAVFTDSVG